MHRSILVVDDEELIRRGITSRLEYLGLTPKALYEAENGIQALEIIKYNEVDIVITDIRMPDMNGLEFIKQAKPLNPKMQIIIISGYAEFDYAERAIQLGVHAYLLKPISNDALKKSVSDALARLEEDENLRRALDEGIRTIEEKKGQEFEKSVNDLLRNSSKLNMAKETYDAVDKEFTLRGRWMILGLINIDGENFEQKNFGYKEIELVHSTIKSVFADISSICDKTIVNNMANSNQLFAILSYTSENRLRKEAEKVFTQMQSILWSRMRILITVGISSATKTLSAECTKEAQEAYLQRMIHGSFSLYFYDDMKLLSTGRFPTSKINLLRQYIERRDAGNIEFLIYEIFSDEQIKKYSITYIRAVWISIVSILLREASAFTSDTNNMDRLVLNYDALDSFHSLDEVRRYLYSLILECIQIDDSLDINTKNKIKLAIKYIYDNYYKDISIEHLSNKYGMSSNYFSTVFKRETGQTAVNFITKVRIQKACESLVNSDKSAVDIAKEIGYEDSQYFFRVFKKITGQTPLQYKKTHS